MLRVYIYLTAALNECMEVIYIQDIRLILYNQVYSTKTFIFLAGGEWKSQTSRRDKYAIHNKPRENTAV